MARPAQLIPNESFLNSYRRNFFSNTSLVHFITSAHYFWSRRSSLIEIMVHEDIMSMKLLRPGFKSGDVTKKIWSALAINELGFCSWTKLNGLALHAIRVNSRKRAVLLIYEQGIRHIGGRRHEPQRHYCSLLICSNSESWFSNFWKVSFISFTSTTV